VPEAASRPRRPARKKTRPPSTSLDPVTSYARAVLAGEIVAGPHVRNACRRHLDDLIHGPARGLTFDLEAVERAIGFFRDVLRLNGGQFEGKPFVLAPSQAFKVGSIFGWKEAGGSRRFRRAYIEEGKGNGKSPLAGGIGLYGLVADGEAGAEVYAAGAKKEQAAILFRDAVKMVTQSPALEAKLTFSGGPGREFNIAHLATGSFFRPISRQAGTTGSGPRPHFALCDEVHEHPDRGVMEMLERGFKFRLQPLLLMITNSGSDRNSICREEHDHAVRVAAGTRTPDDAATYVGEVIDDTTFSYVCGLDVGDDPLTDPTCWIKANPLLGVILKEEYLAGVVAQAKAMPGKLNGILRLHFCVWTDSATAWISRETLKGVLADFDPAEHAGKRLFTGTDLSATGDLTAAAHVVQTGEVARTRPDGSEVMLPTYDAWIEAWTPGDTLAARVIEDQAPYDVWVAEGHLNAPPGKRVRMDFVAAHFAQLDQTYEIAAAAYDRYAYRSLFSPELEALGLQFPQLEHPQGGVRRAKPTQEQIDAAKAEGREPPQGLWMPGSVEALETLILDGRIRLRGNPVLISACMAAVLQSDAFGNRWFVKAKATQRIDPLVSLAMAVGAATAAPAESGPSYQMMFF
jgi:phage terminase large subunit-like protein